MTDKVINPDDYSIVWLCPLPIETAAALFMLDDHHDGTVSRQHGQTAEYHFGKIGSHNVAIAGFPSGEVGIGKAGTMAEAAVRDFRNLELGLLVGIGAAIPSDQRDIRLGDVAVADPSGKHPGIISYDMAKVSSGDEQPKQWMEATHPLWRSVISKIRARATVSGDTFQRHLKAFQNDKGKRFQSPGNAPPLHAAFHEQYRHSHDPCVHYGSILSGNKVIRATEFRDKLKERFADSIALEMEAAGVMTTLPVAVVRGISDAADHHKNDEWHARAAAVAAAYAKEMLLQLSPKTVIQTRLNQETSQATRLRGQIPKQWELFGRTELLETISARLDRVNERVFEKSVLVLSGLSGTGKSQLAAAYVKDQLTKDPRRDIFWINGRDRKAFEASIFHFTIDKRTTHISTETKVAEDIDKKTAEAVKAFFEDLDRPGNVGWLMVVDEATNWNEDTSSNAESVDLNDYLDMLSRGSILMTTNRQNWLTGHSNIIRVDGLDSQSAVQLLKSKLRGRYTRDEELLELATALHFLPLSLRLAITHILKRGIKVLDYVRMWKNRKLDRTLMQGDPTVTQTLNLCFEELDSRAADAARLLTLFGHLDHKNLSFDLVSKAESSDLPPWLLTIAHDEDAFDEAIEALMDLSFVQLSVDGDQGNIYSIHPAIHAFARLRNNSSQDNYISWAISLIADNVPRSLESDYWRKAQAIEPHADRCMTYIRTGRFRPEVLERMGALFRLLGRYEEAAALYNVVLKSLLPHRNAYLETFSHVLNDLGLVYYGQHKFGLAVETFRNSIETYSELPDDSEVESEDTLMCMKFNHGNACRMMQDIRAAETVFDQVYEFFNRKKQTIAYHPLSWVDVTASRVLSALGELRLERKETRNAIYFFRRALNTQEEHLEETHPIVLSTQMNLARAYTDLGGYPEARKILHEITTTYKEHFGADHEAFITAADELARASMGYGQNITEHDEAAAAKSDALLEAETLWTDNLAFYGVKYGDESEHALRTKANIALLQSVKGDLNLARRNMLQVFQRSTIPAQRVKAQCDLALICQQMNDLDVAMINFAQAVAASESLSEPARTRELFRSMYHQAQLCLSRGDHARYVEILEGVATQEAAEKNEWQQRARSELAVGSQGRGGRVSTSRRASEDAYLSPMESPVSYTPPRKRKWQLD